MRLDPEQIYELALPLADERLGHYQQDALCALRAALGNNQAGLDRLSQADFVCENAAAFAKTAKGEYYCINLVWVRINPRLALRRRIALAVVRAADPDKVLGENSLIEGVHIDSYVRLGSC